MKQRFLSSPPRFFAYSALILMVCLGWAISAVAAGPVQGPGSPSGPKIWLQDSQPLPVVHTGAAPGLLGGITPGQPVAMAPGDFDQDGVTDLAVGYSAAGGGGFIAIHRGNLDAFAPQSDASFQAIARGQFPSPFLVEAQTFGVPVSPDFIAAGDFTGLGNTDLVVASRGGSTLYIFSGDGKGNFTAGQTINLPGGVTALAADRFGSMHSALIVGVSNPQQSFLAVYGHGQQGLTPLAAVPLNAPASNILYGHFGDRGPDAAFLSGGHVQILRPSTMQVVTVSLPVSVRAFALGSFIYDRSGGTQIALLAPDGSVQIAARSEFDPRAYTVEEFNAIRQAKVRHEAPPLGPVASFPVNGWKIVDAFPSVGTVAPGQAPVFFRTRISSNGADDIMWLNAGHGQMAVISHPDVQPGAQTFVPGQVSVKPYNGSPVAGLPIRINVDGRPGVVALHQGEIAPSMLMPIPDPTFTVNRFDDPVPASPITNACNAPVSTDCSLREAVLRANALAGTDTIQLAAGTYQLTRGRIASPAYDAVTGTLNINDSVNITGTVDGGGNPTSIITWGALTSGLSVDMVMAVNEDISILSNATASISNVIIQNGVNHGTHSNDGDGGCMEYDTGTSGNANLTLTNVIIQNCATLQGGGGGLVTFNFLNHNNNGFATITNSIIQNNSAVDNPSSGSGGGIGISNDARMVMTNSKVLNNNATQVISGQDGQGGGIIAFFPNGNFTGNPQTVIHSSTISGNKAAGFGGGIQAQAQLLIDQGTVISGNTAGTDLVNLVPGEGGGLYLNNFAPASCPVGLTCSATLSHVTITGNTARGNGGGISNGSGSASGPLSMSFSRLAGNSVTGGGSLGSNLNNNHATATVTNNWWGTNAAATTINSISATTTFDPFIVLTHTANLMKIKINTSSILTGDMSNDNHGAAVGLANLDRIIGLPITFDTPVLGSIPDAQPETLNGSAQATATFNAGGTGGRGSAHATVDQAIVSVDSNLIASATEAVNTVTITTVGAHGFVAGESVVISGVGVGGYNGTFTITGATATTFTYTNPTSGLGASSGGLANVGIIILQPPTITKNFSPTTVAVNAPSTITFTIDNSVNVVAINASFVDSLPANLVVATTPNVVNNCGGAVTAPASATHIDFSNAALAVGSCTIKVDVQGTVDNIYSNSVQILSSDAGNGNTANASLTVINPPSILKAFGAATIPLNGTTSLTFTINSTNVNLTLNGVAFTDNLPSGLVVATPGNPTTNCSGGTATAVDGSSSVSLSGASLTPGASCTVSVTVQGTTAGVKNNTTAAITSSNGGTGATSNTASITVVAPPVIIKAFGAASIPLNGSTSLSFTIQNNNTVTLNGIGFSDTLPAGLVVSTPNGLTGTCGGGTITAAQNTNLISLSGASLAASSSCNFSVNVTGTSAGQQNNTTGNVTSTEGGTGGTASASITVVGPPSIAKAFGAATIPLNGTTSLTFTITDPAANTVAETGVAFTDTLPTGLVVATPNGLSNTCGGTATAVAGSTSISLTGGSIATPNTTCTVVVNITGTASGNYTNTSGAVTSTNGGTGNTASANLIVASPPTITKVFGAASIPLNGTTSLTFTITNPNTGVALTGLAFTDNLPSGLVVATPNGLTSTCGGTATAVAGSGSVSLSGGTVAASANCTLSVNITGTTAGVKNNSVQVTSTEGGTGNTSNASITVVAPPVIIKAFGAASIPLNGSTSLTFTIQNNNTTVGLTGIGFSDTLPAGLVVSTPNGLTGTCGGGTITATQATNVISLTGATLAASSSCTFSVNVTGTSAGQQNNTTGNVTSTEGGTGGTASASINVVAPPSIAKAFGAAAIPLNGTTSLTFTITNPAANAVAEAGVAFTDTLPAGLVVATPNGLTNNCGGTATAVAGSGSISLTGGTIAASSTCTVTVNITGTTSGNFVNTTGNVSSTNGGTGNTATANLAVATPPTITKAFGAASIPLNGSTSLTFNITNPGANTIPLTGVAFTDNLPAGLVVATPNGLSSTCGGTATAVAGASSLSLSGATLAVNTSCTLSVNITGTTAGVKNNSVQVTSTEGGTGNTSNASITVVAPPVIIKAFGAASIPLNGSTSLSFTIQNNNTTTTLNGIGFSDTLPAGLVVSTPNGLTGTCGGGTITATQAANVISMTGATLAASTSCTFSVNVTGTTAGTKNNTTGNVTSTEGGTGGTASASINVVAPPSIAKAFNPAAIAVNGTSTLTFTITNPAANAVAEAGVAFTDNLPAGMVVATPNGLTNTCGGTATATAGSSSASLTGGTVAAASTCTVSVNVTASSSAIFTNTTGAVSSTNGGTGNTATANLTVKPANLSITKTHQGTFHRGQNGAQYTITVSDSASAGPTVGTVTVVDTLPNVQNTLVPTALTGTGWTCTLGTLTCTRSDVLAPGASYPAITLTVNIPQNIQNNFTNTATVSGGGDPNNHTASDPVSLGPPIHITSTDSGAATVKAGTPATFNFQVDASGVNPPPTVVAFTCSGLPAGTACIFTPLAEGQIIQPLTMMVTTLGHVSATAPPFGKDGPPVFAALLFPVVGLVGVWLRGRRSKKTRLRLALAFGGLMLLLALAGCGGNPQGFPTVTPRGTFTITVTGTASTAQGTVQGSATVTLTVQ